MSNATDDRAIYRIFYKGIADEAIQAGLAADMKGFNRLAREVVPAGTFNTTVDALVDGLDILEAIVDERIADEIEEPDEPDEDEAYRQEMWTRACNWQLKANLLRIYEPYPETLTAQLFNGQWAVVDGTGGVWHPSTEARAEINASSDPRTEAVRICRKADERGQWNQ